METCVTDPASPEPAQRTWDERGGDRRKRPTPMFSRYTFFGGRRRNPRRDWEREGTFVDLYEPRLAILVCAFFFLTVLDSVSTVIYLRKGGEELNPIAKMMLDHGEVAFVFIKGMLTMICSLFVLLHKNFRYANIALGVGFSFYFALAIYHLVLQTLAYVKGGHPILG
jgi:Domain of unknown function (DUF5658)